MIKKINIFKKSNSLSKVIFLNILFSYLFYGISLLVSFFSIPYLLELLSDNQYGVWITIFSVLTWFTFLDLGISQGLRNKLTEYFSTNNFSPDTIKGWER